MTKKIIWTIVIIVILIVIVTLAIRFYSKKEESKNSSTGGGNGSGGSGGTGATGATGDSPRPASSGNFPLSKGSTGGEVWDIQQTVNKFIAAGKVNLPRLVQDGIWGDKTEAGLQAVINYDTSLPGGTIFAMFGTDTSITQPEYTALIAVNP